MKRFQHSPVTLRIRRTAYSLSLVCLVAIAMRTAAKAEDASVKPDFATEVVPILRAHCFECHAGDASEGDLKLDSFAGLARGGKSSAAIVPGSPDESLLILAVRYEDESLQMPPEKKMGAAEIDVLRNWIAAGATHPDGQLPIPQQKPPFDIAVARSFWSFQAPVKSAVPGGATERSKVIDAFINEQLTSAGIRPNETADKRTLIRRVTFDLTGLPPTPSEIREFLDDPSADAFSKVVDRLLASPHYGERWGRHWLDVARYADSNGLDENVAHGNAWRYRDYVIQAFNQDKPFDQFVHEQLAGDLMIDESMSLEQKAELLTATGFLSLGPKVLAEGDELKMQMDIVDEQIDTFGKVFLGMTFGCARCHDHKFDPVTQEDYYGLYATFSGIRHGSVPLATPEQHQARAAKLKPLNEEKAELEKSLAEHDAALLKRAREKLAEYEAAWTRAPVDRTGTEDRFEPVKAKFVRLICEAQDSNPNSATGFGIDEFEVWSVGEASKNVALSRNGGRATGNARK
ncbi:MAG: DUF1549 domain-containing protein, partial [Planctomycetaceae bacterium]|nr:DUF1549 domain-containing protein [Planctomycetaceae bacterium]